jgi:hypothetical protein
MQPKTALAEGAAAALSMTHATICSHLFWPELQKHKVKLPEEVEVALEVRRLLLKLLQGRIRFKRSPKCLNKCGRYWSVPLTKLGTRMGLMAVSELSCNIKVASGAITSV